MDVGHSDATDTLREMLKDRRPRHRSRVSYHHHGSIRAIQQPHGMSEEKARPIADGSLGLGDDFILT